MWVVLSPWLIGDGKMPSVAVGTIIDAAIELDASTSTIEPITSDEGDSSRVPAPYASAGTPSSWHAIAGTCAKRGRRAGIQTDSMFIVVEGADLSPGRVYRVFGSLYMSPITDAEAQARWQVRRVLLQAPWAAGQSVVGHEPPGDAAAPSGLRFITSEELHDASADNPESLDAAATVDVGRAVLIGHARGSVYRYLVDLEVLPE